VPVIVDFLCATCGTTAERVVSSPPPASAACDACGGAARRLFSGVGLLRGAAAPRPAARSAGCAGGAVPGACTMHPEVASVWSARVRGDNRALDAALESQDRFLRTSGVTADQLARNRSGPAPATDPAGS
jgi:predicted nucleic acid-binding Zn ribbon protein